MSPNKALSPDVLHGALATAMVALVLWLVGRALWPSTVMGATAPAPASIKQTRTELRRRLLHDHVAEQRWLSDLLGDQLATATVEIKNVSDREDATIQVEAEIHKTAIEALAKALDNGVKASSIPGLKISADADHLEISGRDKSVMDAIGTQMKLTTRAKGGAATTAGTEAAEWCLDMPLGAREPIKSLDYGRGDWQLLLPEPVRPSHSPWFWWTGGIAALGALITWIYGQLLRNREAHFWTHHAVWCRHTAQVTAFASVASGTEAGSLVAVQPAFSIPLLVCAASLVVARHYWSRCR